MAKANETPRQKMIAVMYIVLIALLALNVSRDVINAFVVVNESVLLTNENFSQKLKNIYASFEKKYQLNQKEVGSYWGKAKKARLFSHEMVEYIQDLRIDLISETENISKDSARIISVANLKRQDNYDTPTNFFVGNSEDGSKGKARELKNKINDYRKNMLELVEEKYLPELKLGLITNGDYFSTDGKTQTWETHHFYNTILTAAIVILNKTITEVYNAEFDIVNILFDAVDAEDFKYDLIEAKILPESNYVYIGDEYNAEIFVAAYDTSKSHEIYLLKGDNYLPGEQYENARFIESKPGEIKIHFPAKSEGIKKYAGFIRTKTSNGNVNDYHFYGEYMVAKPSFTISAKKMNVLYIGVENPISIAVSGIPEENLLASISCGTIKYNPVSDDWIVNIPSEYTEAIIDVTTNINGITTKIGAEKFRIKSLPNPVVIIANKNSGRINKETLIAAGKLLSKMPDDFEFDYTFSIRSFTMTTQRGFNVYSFNANNFNLTNEMKDEIKRANRGQKVVFENIIVSDSNGISRSLSPIVFIID